MSDTRRMLGCDSCGRAVLPVGDRTPPAARRYAAAHGWSCTLADLTRPGAGLLDLCPRCARKPAAA